MAEPPFTLSLIVAIADNGVIGRDGRLPWRLKSDLRRFRALTMGHPLIMGRHTYVSIGRPLDGRDTIVVTHCPEDLEQADGMMAVSSFEEAFQTACKCAENRRVTEIFVIGGASIFSEALQRADRIYLTRVHASPVGDVRWAPPLDEGWQELSPRERPASAVDEFPVTDLVLERIRRA